MGWYMRLVIPFATSQYNWTDLQAAYKVFQKSSPTKEVEASGVQLSQPGAFMAVFKDRDMGWVKSHISISFLIMFPSTMVREFEEFLFMITFHSLIRGDMGGDLLLATGTLQEWDQALDLLNGSNNRTLMTYNETYKELKAYLRKYEA